MRADGGLCSAGCVCRRAHPPPHQNALSGDGARTCPPSTPPAGVYVSPIHDVGCRQLPQATAPLTHLLALALLLHDLLERLHGELLCCLGRNSTGLGLHLRGRSRHLRLSQPKHAVRRFDDRANKGGGGPLDYRHEERAGRRGAPTLGRTGFFASEGAGFFCLLRCSCAWRGAEPSA